MRGIYLRPPARDRPFFRLPPRVVVVVVKCGPRSERQPRARGLYRLGSLGQPRARGLCVMYGLGCMCVMDKMQSIT